MLIKILLIACGLFAVTLDAAADEVLVLTVSESGFSGYTTDGAIIDFQLMSVKRLSHQFPEIQPDATKYLNQLIGGQRVDVDMRVVNGRNYAIVNHKGRNINVEMVRSGHGLYDSDRGEWKALEDAHEMAEKEQRGLWPSFHLINQQRRRAREVAAKAAAERDAQREAEFAKQEVERRNANATAVLKFLIPQLSYGNDVFATTLHAASKNAALPKNNPFLDQLSFTELDFSDPNILNESWDLQRSGNRLFGRLYAIDAKKGVVSICDQEGAIVTVAINSPSLTSQDVERRIRYALVRHHMLLSCTFLSRVHDKFTNDEHHRIIQSSLTIPSIAPDKQMLDIFGIVDTPRYNNPYLFMFVNLDQFARYTPPNSRRHGQTVPPRRCEELAAAYKACLDGRLAGREIDESLKIIKQAVYLKSIHRSAIIEASQSLADR